MTATVSRTAKRVLVLEDDPVYRRLLEYEFVGQSYSVVSATEADSAIEKLSAEGTSFDLGIFDMKIPPRAGEPLNRTEGFRVLEWARKQFPEMVLIAITSINVDDIAERMTDLKVKVFHRPISVSEIHKFVDLTLG